MSTRPRPTAAIAALPSTTPFVAPEELARAAGLRALLRLGANESAFGPPPRSLAAMRGELERLAWYGDPSSAELRDALAVRFGCDADNVTVTSGIDDLLGLIARAYLEPGAVALATAGTYPTFAFHAIGYGARLEAIPYATSGAISLDALAAKACAVGARVVYLANPDNPSGTFRGRAEIEGFVRALPETTLLLLDEAYADFVAPAELLAPAIHPRVVRGRTFSKAYGLAGARIAYALAAPEVGATLQKIRHHYGVNRNAQIGALAALDDGAFVAGVVAETERGRADYVALGARLGIETLPSRTNFVCFDGGSRERAETLVADLLRRGVFIRKPNVAPLDRYVRVSVGTPEERARFADIFAQSLAELPAAART
ncbi:MAG: aminotransferase class I/II-fold pyridoxal phosphate-dependent enzyme [Candidatus Baltobacteraceae bacterium]